MTRSSFADNAAIGPDAAANDNTLFGDGLHSTTLGQGYLEPDYRAVVNAL